MTAMTRLLLIALIFGLNLDICVTLDCDATDYSDVVVILDDSSINNVAKEFQKMRDFSIEMVKLINSLGARVHFLLFGNRFEILGTRIGDIAQRLNELQPKEKPQKDDEENKAVGSFDASMAFASVLRDINMEKKPQNRSQDQSINFLPIFSQFRASRDKIAGIMVLSTFLTPLPSDDVMIDIRRRATLLRIDNNCGIPASLKPRESSPHVSHQVASFLDSKAVAELLVDVKKFVCAKKKTTTVAPTTTPTTTTTTKSTTTSTTTTQKVVSTKIQNTTASEKEGKKIPTILMKWGTPKPLFQPDRITTSKPEETTSDEVLTNIISGGFLLHTEPTFSSKLGKYGKEDLGKHFTVDPAWNLGNKNRTIENSTSHKNSSTSEIVKIGAGQSQIPQKSSGESSKTVGEKYQSGNFPAKILIVSLLVCLLLGIVIAVVALLIRGRNREAQKLDVPAEEFGILAAGAKTDEAESMSMSSSNTPLKANIDEVELET